MRVNIYLSSSLSEHEKVHSEIYIDDGKTALEVIKEYGFPEEEIGIIQKNGIKINLSDVLCDGDTIKIYPLIIAG